MQPPIKPQPTNASNPAAMPTLATLLLQMLLGVVQSPWLKALITAILSSLGTVALIRTGGCFPQPPIVQPPPPPPPPPIGTPADAIGRISIGNVGCTATIIGPVAKTDKKLVILTAAHCVRVGQIGTMFLKDGRKLGITCVTRDAASDCAWLTAIRPEGEIPWLPLAEELPKAGDVVWHQGYGVDRPNSRESGEFLGVSGDNRQCRFRLSVSSGDSGGGIITNALNRVISPVCCTTRLAGVGEVFGGTPMAAAAIRPANLTATDEPPLFHPVLPEPIFRENLPILIIGDK